MKTRKATGLYNLLMVSATLIALLALMIILATPGASANAGVLSGGTPHTETAHPEHTGTVQATETGHPEATGTTPPEATGTTHPEATGTTHPEATGTTHPEATETHHPEATGTAHPEATETHHPEATGTAHPEATGTTHPEHTGTPHPEGTGTPHPEPSHTVVATGTVHPEPSHTPVPLPTHALMLDPHIHFEDIHAGQTRSFQLILRNNTASATTVTFGATSQLGWTVAVAPQSATVAAGGSATLTVNVSAPATATGALDTVTVVGTDGAHTASAYIILLLQHHDFADLDTTSFAYNPVQHLTGKGAISGYSDGTFRPSNTVTRAQFAKMLVAGMGWPLTSPATATFRDVPATDWAFAYVETAVLHGALSGYSDGTFRPTAEITRAQLAKLIVVGRGWPVETSLAHFSDVPAGDWAFGYIETAVNNGVLTGYSDGTYRPTAPATRAQVAKILSNGLVMNPDR